VVPVNSVALSKYSTSLQTKQLHTAHSQSQTTMLPMELKPILCHYKVLKEGSLLTAMLLISLYMIMKIVSIYVLTSTCIITVIFLDPVVGFVGARALRTGLSSSCQHGIKVTEGDKTISVELERTGDTSEQVSVKCETVALTAKASEDYKERHKRVTFEPGQTKAFCNVTIVDNNEFEEQEYFQLQLTHPLQRALVNKTSSAFCVMIDEDINDSELVKFYLF